VFGVGIPSQTDVVNGFNGNLHFSTFRSEILHVCSYLLKKPNDMCLELEFLCKRMLSTVLTDICIISTFSTEILHVCSSLLKKPNGRYLGSEFLRKWSLLTVLTEIHILNL